MSPVPKLLKRINKRKNVSRVRNKPVTPHQDFHKPEQRSAIIVRVSVPSSLFNRTQRHKNKKIKRKKKGNRSERRDSSLVGIVVVPSSNVPSASKI